MARMAFGAVGAVAIVPGIATTGAHAQQIQRGEALLSLPRPGYETGRWQVGNVTLLPLLTTEAHYDSNVFATSRDTIGDTVANIGPRLDIVADGRRLNLTGDIEANGRIHATQSSEDSFTFGGGAGASFAAGGATQIDGKLHFDRAIQSRADPEANPTLFHPARLNSFVSELGYRYNRSRVDIAVRGGVQSINYLDPNEADRDLTSYSASVRLGLVLSPRITAFVQGYGNRRNARLAVDRNGIDRDVTTFGALGGFTLDITGRWRGEVGIGGFKANPDGALPSFSGLALDAKMLWMPTPRISLTFDASSGDVGTIRAGASGRVDDKFALHFDAEARHNLLVHAGITYDATSYRGSIDRRLQTWLAEAEVELLLNRNLSLFVAASQTNRHANSVFDRFERTTVGVGVRLRE